MSLRCLKPMVSAVDPKTAKRDAAAALRFFRKAIRQHGEPEVVTIDKSSANTQYQPPQSNGLSSAEQFYLLTA